MEIDTCCDLRCFAVVVAVELSRPRRRAFDSNYVQNCRSEQLRCRPKDGPVCLDKSNALPPARSPAREFGSQVRSAHNNALIIYGDCSTHCTAGNKNQHARHGGQRVWGPRDKKARNHWLSWRRRFGRDCPWLCDAMTTDSRVRSCLALHHDMDIHRSSCRIWRLRLYLLRGSHTTWRRARCHGDAYGRAGLRRPSAPQQGLFATTRTRQRYIYLRQRGVVGEYCSSLS